MKKNLLFALLAAASLTACEKDEDYTPAAPTKETLLVSKSWRVTGWTGTHTIDGKLITTDIYDDAYDIVPAYKRDDFYTFKADKTYVIDEGATKSNPADPQTETDSWALNSDQTKLTLGGGPYAQSYDLTELTPTTMVLTAGEDIGTPDEVTIKVTYTAL